MEVQLEVVDSADAPKDTFVSLRIGDIQKQSRITGSRKYNFPDPGPERRKEGILGRIEVFKRVGTVNVAFDDSEFQALSIPCDFPQKTHLGLKVGIKGTEPVPKPVKSKRAKERMDVAKQYLVDHGLEEILAESMREVIQKRPSDPFKYLSGLILKHSKAPTSSSQPKAGTEVDALRMEAKKALLSASKDGSLTTSLAGLPKTSGPSQSADSVAQKPSISQESLDTMRAQANDCLSKASADGRLSEALKRVNQKDPLDEIRAQAKNALLQASKDGKLQEALGLKPQEESVEDIRKQARDTLLKASGDGSLATALAPKDDMEELRAQARATLVKASANGSLSTALSSNSQKDVLEDIRAQARQTLLKASKDGSLESSVDKLCAKDPTESFRKQARDAFEKGFCPQDLHSQARKALLQGCKDGKLFRALTKGDLRAQARNALLQSCQNGTLSSALNSSGNKDTGAAQEDLRSRARNTLLIASRNGNLLTAFAKQDGVERLRLEAKSALANAAREGILSDVMKATGTANIPLDVEELRKQARQALVGAAQDGSLTEAMNSTGAGSRSADQLRREARTALVSAAKDGSLAGVLRNETAEQMRVQAANTFLKASKDGSLLATLQNMSGGCTEDDDVEDLRAQCANVFMKASQDGSLLATLTDMGNDNGNDVEELRLQAKSLFVQASLDGSLVRTLESGGKSTSAAMTGQRFKTLPSVGSWLAPRPMRTQVWKLPEHPEVQVSVADVVEQAAPERAFEFQPSVGSWLSPRPTRQAQAPNAAPADPSAKCPPAFWEKLYSRFAVKEAPLAAPPPIAAPVSPFAKCPPELWGQLHSRFGVRQAPLAAPTPIAAPVSPFAKCPPELWGQLHSRFGVRQATAAAPPCGKLPAFQMRPSVGTWLGSRSSSIKVCAPTREKPAAMEDTAVQNAASPKAFAQTATPLSPVTQRVLNRTHSQMVTMPTEELIDAFKETILEKEREIAELKAKLAVAGDDLCEG